MDLTTLTLREASEKIRAKEISATELVSAYLKNIEEKEKDIHSYIDVYREEAIKEAQNADAAASRGEKPASPLFGIPLAVKDNILIKHKRTTAASRILERYIAPYDAGVIRKLKAEGAIFLGKTNMDDSAMGSSTESSIFGPTKNPADLGRVPGGSSGGSAAAVAARLAAAALGSDTGGSIRQPASFCGIVGLKPTYGAVSRHGLIAMTSSLDQIGPMAKTVEDAEILFHAIRGEDAFDATSSREPFFPDASPRVLGALTIGVPKEYFSDGLDPEVKTIIESVLRAIEKEGAKIKEISLAHSHAALPAYYIIVPSEVSSNLARLDGIRYGYHADEAETLFQAYAKSRAVGFGPEIKRRIMLGTYALSAGYYDAYYTKAQKVRRLIQQDFLEAFTHVDIIIGPTTPTPAFPLGARTENPIEMYLADIYTVAVNLAGIPALSLPAGSIAKEGSFLPVGLQLIAPHWQEERLFSAGKAIEHLVR